MENNYKEIMNNISELKQKKEITPEEIELLNEFEDLIKLKRVEKLSNYLVENNTKLNDFSLTINEKLKDYIEGESRFSKRRKEMIDRLNGVKAKNIEFKDNLVGNNCKEETALIDKCLNTLSNGKTLYPIFFDQVIAKDGINFPVSIGYNINEYLIKKLYRLVNKENFLNDLSKGIKIYTKTAELENNSIIYKDALSYKERLYNNIDSVISYNKIIKQIDEVVKTKSQDKYVGLEERKTKVDNEINKLESNSITKFIFKNKLNELNNDRNILSKRERELEEFEELLENLKANINDLSEKLKKEDLLDLISEYDFNKRNNKNLAIKNNIRNISSKEDLDDYYNEVELKNKDNQKLLGSLINEKIKFNDYADKEALGLINNDIINAIKLAELNNKSEKYNIDPKLAIYIIKTYNDLKKMKLENMNITIDEYNSLKNYYDRIINNELATLYQKYTSSLEGNKIIK